MLHLLAFLENGMAAAPRGLGAIGERFLAGTQSHAVVWCGKGATALYWAFLMARLRRPDVEAPEVVLPALLCPSPANAALAAGLTVRFADVDPTTGLVTAERVAARMSQRTVAVLFVHLYGHTATLDHMQRICRQHNTLLIEDAAQALGGQLPDGNPVGAAGDACVYSFNATKILECGGGALTVKHEDCVRLLDRVMAATPVCECAPERLQQLGESFRNLQHSLITLLREREIDACDAWFAPLARKYRDLLFDPFRTGAQLEKAWPGLPQNLRHRMAMAERYAMTLAGGPWVLPVAWRTSGVCWRYTILLDDERNALRATNLLRSHGMLASNHYWPLHHFYNSSDHCPNAERFARHCINLWVDGKADRVSVDQCAQVLLSMVSPM
jgi:dTDP-4-amino-4,6-dideoxygalactose transaminase